MRAAFVNSIIGTGSTGRIVYQLSKIPGVQGRIYYGRKENHTDADAFRVTKFMGNAEHAVFTFLSDRQGFCNTEETERMVENLKAFRPDLIHLHNLHGYYLNVEVLFHYLKTIDTPVIWTMHDCWAFTGHCAHFQYVGCERWKTECAHCPGLSQYPVTWNGAHVTRNYEQKKALFNSLKPGQMTIVTPSIWLREQVKQSFLKDQRIIQISNGIDLACFHPETSAFRSSHSMEGDFVMLAVANPWTREKGLADLQKLAGMLKQNQKLIIVGTTKKQASRFHDLSQVLCIPHTESVQELVQIYSAADVLLNTTYQDTFPTVNIEAQACGCPVITYQTGGSTEMLTKKTGIVVERGNPDALNDAVQALASGKIVLKRSDCMIHAQRYSKDAMLGAYRSLYIERTGLPL